MPPGRVREFHRHSDMAEIIITPAPTLLPPNAREAVGLAS
jgi:hypothetical protein